MKPKIFMSCMVRHPLGLDSLFLLYSLKSKLDVSVYELKFERSSTDSASTVAVDVFGDSTENCVTCYP